MEDRADNRLRYSIRNVGLKSANEIEELQRELRRNERHKETKAEVMTTIE